MKIIKQRHEIINISDNVLETIERAGRTCYKSEDKITKGSAEKFVATLIKHGHEAMLEFGDITVKFITNRGITHEIVRHRLCNFAQESTRYVRYGQDMEFIKPVWWDDSSDEQKKIFLDTLEDCAYEYTALLDSGWKPQQAREILPNALKTEIVVKANIREWRHLLKLRCSKGAHPQIRGLMIPLLDEFKTKIPVVFDDIMVN